MSIFLIYFEENKIEAASDLTLVKLPSPFISLPVQIEYKGKKMDGISIYDGVASDKLLYIERRKIKYSRVQMKKFIDFIESRLRLGKKPKFIFVIVNDYLDQIKINPVQEKLFSIEQLSRRWDEISLNDLVQIS